MKTIEISEADYELLQWLGSDKWMTVKGDKPIKPEKIVHKLIQAEYDKANPKRYFYD